MKDFALLFCKAKVATTDDVPSQELPLTAATATNSTDAMRFKNHTGLGDGRTVRVKAQIIVPFGAAGNSITAKLQSAPDSSGSPGTYVDVVTGTAVSGLVAGQMMLDTLLPKGIVGEHFRVVYTTGATTAFTGTQAKVNSWFEID